MIATTDRITRSSLLIGVGLAVGASLTAPSFGTTGFGTTGLATDLQGQATKKVLLIGIDGVRPDVMAEVDTPNLDALAASGAYSMRARTTIRTVSGPAWSSMLTGVWPAKHGVHSNNFVGNAYATYPDFLTRIEQVAPEFGTFVAADWMPLVSEVSGGPLIGGGGLIGDGPDEVVALDGYELGWAEADRAGTDAAVEALSTGHPDAMFVYLGNPDETSHHNGSIGIEYREAIEEADRQVGRLVAAIRARSTYGREDWLILVSTDHGRRPGGGHGGLSEAELTTFVIVSGPSAAPGELAGTPRIVDVAVTALDHLGIVPPVEWGLDGESIGLQGDRPGQSRAEPAGSTVEIQAADGVVVSTTVYGDPADARALLLLFHQGGANSRAEYDPIVPRLLRNGYAAVAIDARAGGRLLGGTNRTKDRLGRESHYCEAYPDLEAALEYARTIAGDLPIIAWGSSYSGALAMRLAAEHSDDIRGLLAFSPAGGEAMGECPADRFAPDVTVPTLVLRPASEAELDHVVEQTRRFGEMGFLIHIATPGRHGSSMLNENRVEGDTEPTWEAVLEFLARLSARN